MNHFMQTSILAIDDVEAIMGLIKKVYGLGYLIDWFYDRDALVKAILSGNHIFIGAKIKGDLASISYLSFPGGFGSVIEMGTLCTNPRYRGHISGACVREVLSCAKKLVGEYVKNSGVCVLLTMPTTRHLLSQKLQVWSGFILVGLAYGIHPDQHDLHKISLEQDLQHNYHLDSLRRNDLILTAYCYRSKINKISVCLPHNMYSIVDCLFADSPFVFENSQKKAIDGFKLDIQDKELRSLAEIRVSHGNKNSDSLFEEISSFFKKRYKIIHVYLNVGEYNLIYLINELIDKGFIFCGFIPCYYGPEGHGLILQYLNGYYTNLQDHMLLDQKAKTLHKLLLKAMIK
jgi:hypothetical protein